MTVREIFEMISTQTGMSRTDMAGKIGFDYRGRLNARIYRNEGMTMSVRNLIRLLEPLGYQLSVTSVEDDDVEMVLDGEPEL